MRERRWMVVVWACFFARLLFYSTMLPLWEGYDEWAHFSVVRRMAVNGEFLVSREAPIPRDVEESFQLAPVPWEMRSLSPPAVTQDAYWQLSAPERSRRRELLRSLRTEGDGTGTFRAYEALQPPLYYWLMTPVMWLCVHLGTGLVAQVWTLRIVSSAVASTIIPLVFLLGRAVWPRAGLGCAAVVAVMPGLALDVARVGNDCLAVALFTALTLLLVRGARPAIVGTVLAAGLLTKAYFLAAIPIVLVVMLLKRRRGAWPLLVGLVLPAWWYARNLATTGTLSGLSESVMLRGVGAGEMLRRAEAIHWIKAIDAILFSHLYFGGWSSLTVRSWMYHVFYVAILAAAIGLVRLRRMSEIRILMLVYAAFWAAQLYNVALLYLSKGLEGSMGWYMYAVVGAEVALCVAGLSQWLPRAWSIGAVMFALLDLYTVHGVAIPYYTGLIRHRPNGSLEAFHWQHWPVPGGWISVLWVVYLIATVTAVACACARKCDSAANSQG